MLVKLKFMLVGVDYLTKWIDAQTLSKITTDKVRRF